MTFWKGQNLQRCQHSFIEVFRPSARDELLQKVGEERWNATSGGSTFAPPTFTLIRTRVGRG